jgi:hypothetical protein
MLYDRNRKSMNNGTGNACSRNKKRTVTEMLKDNGTYHLSGVLAAPALAT